MIPKKILYISLTNGAGGAEQILLMSAKITQSRVIFLKQVDRASLSLDESQPEVKFLNKHSLLFGFILLIKELINYRRDFIIMSSHPYLNAYLGILKRVGFLKAILISRECTSVFLRFKGLKKFSYKLVYNLGYPAIDLIVCQTNEMRSQLMQNLSFLVGSDIIVQENPIDIPLIRRNSEVPIDDPILKQNYICSAGRLISLKGFDLLIKAFSTLEGQYPGYKLVILGEGEQRNNLQSLIDELGLSDKIILKGFVNNPFPYFKNARVCIVSSINEGFPNVLLQMMALNKYVVSTLCADGIGSFDSVRTVQVNDINALAFAIKDELEKTKVKNENEDYLTYRQPINFVTSILNSIPAR